MFPREAISHTPSDCLFGCCLCVPLSWAMATHLERAHCVCDSCGLQYREDEYRQLDTICSTCGHLITVDEAAFWVRMRRTQLLSSTGSSLNRQLRKKLRPRLASFFPIPLREQCHDGQARKTAKPFGKTKKAADKVSEAQQWLQQIFVVSRMQLTLV